MSVKRLKTSDCIDDLIDRLLALCLLRPFYLRPDSIPRYVALLNQFRHYHMNHWQHWRDPDTDGRRVGELPIQDLDWALETWVMSYHETEGCCLLPTYALDTASMITHHVYGFEKKEFACEALVKTHSTFARFPESSFKGYFTGAMTGQPILVQAQIPANACIRLGKQAVKEAGAEVLLFFTRCHLTASPGKAELVAFDPADSCNLMREFQLNGEFLASKNPYGSDKRPSSLLLRNFMLRSDEEVTGHDYLVPGMLSGPWIKACAQVSNRKLGPMTPIPDWANF